MGSRVVAGEGILGLEEAEHEDVEGGGPTGVVYPGGEDELCGLALWGHGEDYDHDCRRPEHMPPHLQKSKRMVEKGSEMNSGTIKEPTLGSKEFVSIHSCLSFLLSPALWLSKSFPCCRLQIA